MSIKRNEKFWTRKNLLNQRFDRLIVIENMGLHYTPSNKYGEILWKCRCDCGNIKTFHARNLLRKNGKLTSCGCHKYETARLKYKQATYNSLYFQYKAGAKNRKLDFLLTKEEFRYLISDNCYYCHDLPDKKYRVHKSSRISEEWAEQNSIFCHGIDRVDNNLGYILNNCVTCCKSCNFAKHILNQNEFFDKIKKIYNKHFLGK